MAYLNVKERVIEAKIVYYGAGLCGKTTNLEQVKKLSTDGRCGEMMSIDTDGDRTLFFDWLPFNIGKVNGCDVKLQLYTVPGQPQYAETRKKVLASADGIVLVLDSQSGAMDKNREIFTDLREHLRANNMSFDRVPLIVQLNKRDLPTAMAPDELMREVGMAEMPYIEAVAATGHGVFETLREATKRVLEQVRDTAKREPTALKMGDNSKLDGDTLYKAITSQGGDDQKPGGNAPSTTSVVRPPTTSNGAPPLSAAMVPAAAPSTAALQASRRPDADVAAPSGTQLNELVLGQRAVMRRMDALEQATQQAISTNMTELERRLVGKLSSNVEKVDQLASKVTGALESLLSKVDSVAAVVEAMEMRVRAVEAANARAQASLEQSRAEILQGVGAVEKRIAVDGQRFHAAAEQALLVVEKRLIGEVQKSAAAAAELSVHATKSNGKELANTMTSLVAESERRLGGEIGKVHGANERQNGQLREANQQIAALVGETNKYIEQAAKVTRTHLASDVSARCDKTDVLVRETGTVVQGLEVRVREVTERLDAMMKEAAQEKNRSWWR